MGGSFNLGGGLPVLVQRLQRDDQVEPVTLYSVKSHKGTVILTGTIKCARINE